MSVRTAMTIAPPSDLLLGSRRPTILQSCSILSRERESPDVFGCISLFGACRAQTLRRQRYLLGLQMRPSDSKGMYVMDIHLPLKFDQSLAGSAPESSSRGEQAGDGDVVRNLLISKKGAKDECTTREGGGEAGGLSAPSPPEWRRP
jgi:hypothetical protein